MQKNSNLNRCFVCLQLQLGQNGHYGVDLHVPKDLKCEFSVSVAHARFSKPTNESEAVILSKHAGKRRAFLSGVILQMVPFFTEISMCVTAKTTENTISGMLAIIIPENRNTKDGIADRIIAFASPFFFQKKSATQRSTRPRECSPPRDIPSELRENRNPYKCRAR